VIFEAQLDMLGNNARVFSDMIISIPGWAAAIFRAPFAPGYHRRSRGIATA
jgi:hypothetical protein